MRLIPIHPGSTQIQVFKNNNVEPHLVINGAEVEDIDRSKVLDYVRDCDWTDKGAKGYITPQLKCDDFLKKVNYDKIKRQIQASISRHAYG